MSLTTIRSSISTVVAGVTGRSYGYVPDQPNVPCGIVYIETVGYADPRATFRNGTFPVEFVVLLLSGSVVTKGAQQRLDAWLSTQGDATTSVVYALENNSTLNASVPSLLVKECRKAGAVNLVDGGTRYFFAELVVEVLAPAS